MYNYLIKKNQQNDNVYFSVLKRCLQFCNKKKTTTGNHIDKII